MERTVTQPIAQTLLIATPQGWRSFVKDPNPVNHQQLQNIKQKPRSYLYVFSRLHWEFWTR